MPSANTLRVLASTVLLSFLLVSASHAQQSIPEAGPNEKSPELVKQVQSGQRTVANAAWWGFDPADSTEALQAAINSGAKTVIIPKMPHDWVVARTIRLVGDQQLIFQPGAVVAAMKGKFIGRGECLMAAADQQNLTIRGEGATLRMHKEDYTSPPYEKAEWRHALSIVGCSHVEISGLTLRDSGGDGLYLGCSHGHKGCTDVHVTGVICDNNHRQGVSVISAKDLLIENSRFLNTGGTAPEAGIDLEPNNDQERLVNCVIRNCISEGNRGAGLEVYVKPLSARSADLSVRFENCVVRNCKSGMCVGAVKDDGPGGFIEFVNVTVDGTRNCGIYVFDKSAQSAVVRFVRCTLKNTGIDGGYPIYLCLRRPNLVTHPGGFVFDDCLVVDTQDRPFLAGGKSNNKYSLSNIQGKVTVESPAGSHVELGENPSNIDLKITYTQPK